MPRCEDFPCCGHEPGCCPNFDESGRQTDMVCTCGARLPVTSRYSICDACLEAGDEDFEDFGPDFEDDGQPDDLQENEDFEQADEYFGHYEDFGDYWGD